MNPDLFRAVPSAAEIRVRWVDYPFCERTGTGVSDCRCPICEGKPRPIWWEGVVHEGEPLWSPRIREPSLRESCATTQGWTRDGTVRAFAPGTMLVVSDDGRVLTLAPETVRALTEVVKS